MDASANVANVLHFIFKMGELKGVSLNRAPIHNALTELKIGVETRDVFRFSEPNGLRSHFDVNAMRLRSTVSWDFLKSQLRSKGSLLTLREMVSAFAKCQTMEIQFPWIALGSVLVGEDGVLFAPIIRNRKVGIIALAGHPPMDAIYPIRVV